MTTFALEVKNGFNQSGSLDAHIARRIDAALGAYAGHIWHVEVRLSDVNGPRHGAGDKVARIGIRLHPWGRVETQAGADNIYDSVTKAARRARTAVGRRVKRFERRTRVMLARRMQRRRGQSASQAAPAVRVGE